MSTHCMGNMKNPLEIDECEPFIIRESLSDFNEPQHIRFVLTSKWLISNIEISELLCADTTFKLTTLDLPLYVIGTIDAAKRFHFIAIGCCTTEATTDFEFMFESVKVAAQQVGINMAPEILLSDGSMPLINAFYSVFESSAKTNNMCHVHVMRNAVKHLQSENLSTNKNEKAKIVEQFKEDFVILQSSSSKERFEFAFKLFKKKNEAISKELIEYFEDQWVKKPKLCNWYEGANEYVKSNNALEATNNVIKKNYIRSKLPFDLFTERLKLMITDYSTSYIENSRIVHITPTT